MAVAKDWSIDYLEVVGAFLHAILPDDNQVWIRLSTVVGTSLQDQFVELVKSLYGLRQALKLWYEHFAKAVTSICFKRSRTVDCPFIKDGPNPVYIVLYMDNLVVVEEQQAV